MQYWFETLDLDHAPCSGTRGNPSAASFFEIDDGTRHVYRHSRYTSYDTRVPQVALSYRS